MSLINIERFLSPIADGEPAGPNLEYDPEFAALQRSAEGKPERRLGEAVAPAEPPNWKEVFDKSQELLERTRDLRVAILLTQAMLDQAGYPGFAEGSSFVARLLGDFWANVHPELDEEDDNDPTMRISALATLSASSTLLALRSAPLARARPLGTISLRDIQALSSSDSAASQDAPAVDAGTIEGVFHEVEFEELEAVERAVNESLEAISAIDKVFETHTQARGPDFAPLVQLLREVRHVLAPRVAARRDAMGTETPEDETSDSGDQQAVGTKREPSLTGEIRSREDVVRAIDKICGYYARVEPTSPLPLLLERCKRLVSSSFLEIIEDIAPESLQKVTLLGGKKPE